MKINRRTILSAGLTISATSALAACSRGAGANNNSATDSGEGTSIKLVLGHEGSLEDPRQVAAERLKELVETGTDGRVTVEINANGTLGNWEQMIEGLQFGSTDIVIESLLTLEQYTELASIETAPFLYRNTEHFTSTWRGEIGKNILTTIGEETGFYIGGAMYRGARQLTTKTPVTSINDLSGLTIRTPSNPTMVDTWNALGARAEAMPWDEVYSALEQGVLDGQENPLSSILFASIHEVAPEVTLTSHIHANFHFILWNEKVKQLSAEDKTVLDEAMATVSEEYTNNILEAEAGYKSDMEAAGATFHELTDRESWVEATSSIYTSLPEQVQQWANEIAG